MGGTYIRFKRKGAYGTGITLEEAQGRLQFSSKDVYPFSDMHADGRRRIILKVKVRIICYAVIVETLTEGCSVVGIAIGKVRYSGRQRGGPSEPQQPCTPGLTGLCTLHRGSPPLLFSP